MSKDKKKFRPPSGFSATGEEFNHRDIELSGDARFNNCIFRDCDVYVADVRKDFKFYKCDFQDSNLFGAKPLIAGGKAKIHIGGADFKKCKIVDLKLSLSSGASFVDCTLGLVGFEKIANPTESDFESSTLKIYPQGISPSMRFQLAGTEITLSLIHISEPTRPY